MSVFDLATRNFYLCVGLRDDLTDFVRTVVDGGVDVVQLREKFLDLDAQRGPARELAALCRDLGVPFVVNDSPELAYEVGADGVHVGQDDVSVAHCREVLGDEAIVGLSTHAVDELERSLPQFATYFSAGPIEATPTKPGRPGVGTAYATYATHVSRRPVFVTGGVTDINVGGLIEAGLRHFVVVRALTESANPGESARRIRAAIDRGLSTVTV
jgi:thiamine-phosphate pyrophosphorylase